MRILAGVALVAAVSCSTPPPAAEPAPPEAAPRVRAAKPSDTMARADQLVADAAKREAEYQQTLKDQQERKGVPIYNQYTPLGEPVAGNLPEPSPGRTESWWRAEVQELRRRMDHNAPMMRQAFQKLEAARGQLAAGTGDAVTARVALRDAEAEYQLFSKAFYRDSDHLHNMRVKAREWGVPKEWWQ